MGFRIQGLVFGVSALGGRGSIILVMSWSTAFVEDPMGLRF